VRVKLIKYTDSAERVIVAAARTCYSELLIEEIYDTLSEDKISQLLQKLIKNEHLSPFEHASFTFSIGGISRVCSHQLVRHRIASYTQQSQRYTKLKDIKFVIPESIKKSKEAKAIYEDMLKNAKKAWQELINLNIPYEDARYILPQAVTTNIVLTMNARELLHFFKLRLSQKAQHEIRLLAEAMLKEVKKVAPNIFGYFKT
jgi:thymidylate synthase (FAD)